MEKLKNKLICGETLTELKKIPNNFVNLGITSPPYNKQEKNKGWLVKNVKYDKFKDIKTEKDYQENQIDVLNELFRITKEGGSFFYNHKIRWDRGEMIHPMQWLLKTDWTIKQEIVWDRMIAGNIRGWRFWQVEERIYWLYKPINKNKIGKELLSKHALQTSIWRIRPEGNNPHPAPFPIELPTRIINSILDDEDGVVIDPYCGSGTTIIAAKLLNKNFIGIDISQEYLDYAKRRLENYQSENKKVLTELQKHKVIKTFSKRKEEKLFTGKFQSLKNKEIKKENKLF